MHTDQIYLGPRGTNNLYNQTHSNEICEIWDLNSLPVIVDTTDESFKKKDIASGPLSPIGIQFDSWLEEYLAQIEVTKNEEQQDMQFDRLRRIFHQEMLFLTELYKPIKKHVLKVLQEDYQNKGSRLYYEWGRTLRKEFLLSYYDNKFFRAQYAQHRFLNSALTLMQALTLRILPSNSQLELFLLTRVRRVVSVGVGPCSDVAAFVSFLRTRGVHHALTYFLLDQCHQWNDYAQLCDRAWSEQHKVSLWFKTSRFGQLDSVSLLPEADMLVFSFANTSLMEPAIWPLLKQRFPLVIVLDGIKEILLEGFDECQFDKFKLNEKNNLYYSFNAPADLDCGSVVETCAAVPPTSPSSTAVVCGETDSSSSSGLVNCIPAPL